nr:MAG TPA: Cell wall hydrolase autolysin [Caudoviricetes sp.]
MKILIDNGHGINTSGKCSPDKQYKEYAHARKLAAAIVNSLVNKGYDAELLVPETTDVPLKERCRRVNSWCDKLGTKNVIMVSVHSNAGGNGQWVNARGWSVWTSPGKTKADDLATCIYNAADICLADYKQLFTAEDTARHQKAMRADWSDGDPDYEANFYILAHTKCPAVLTENLFHDNKTDLAFLTSDAGVTAIVNAHVQGIMQYVKSL